MKRYQITIDGRMFDVKVLGDPSLDRVEVDVDGEVLAVEVRRPVEATAAPAMPAAGLGSAPRTAAPTAPARAVAPSAPGGRSVLAPLPGVIKRVAVEAGHLVKPGDMLLVIEAMKMDNTIRATRGGVIEAVHAVEGRQVAHGDELLRYEL